MGLLFQNDLHDEFGTWPLAYIPWGGADFGEIRAVGKAVGDGDDAAFYDAWMQAGDRIAAEAEAALADGTPRRPPARASCAPRASTARPTTRCSARRSIRALRAAFDRQMAAFDRGARARRPRRSPPPRSPSRARRCRPTCCRRSGARPRCGRC